MSMQCKVKNHALLLCENTIFPLKKSLVQIHLFLSELQPFICILSWALLSRQVGFIFWSISPLTLNIKVFYMTDRQDLKLAMNVARAPFTVPQKAENLTV